MSSRKEKEWIELTSEMIAELRSIYGQCWISLSKVVLENGEARKGLSAYMTERMIYGTVRKVRKTNYEFLLTRLKEAANSAEQDRVREAAPNPLLKRLRHVKPSEFCRLKPGYIAVNEEDRKFLQEEKKRTGLGGLKLWHYADEEAPEGLNAYIIINITNGGTKSTRPEYLDYIKVRYAGRPTKK